MPLVLCILSPFDVHPHLQQIPHISIDFLLFNWLDVKFVYQNEKGDKIQSSEVLLRKLMDHILQQSDTEFILLEFTYFIYIVMVEILNETI